LKYSKDSDFTYISWERGELTEGLEKYGKRFLRKDIVLWCKRGNICGEIHMVEVAGTAQRSDNVMWITKNLIVLGELDLKNNRVVYPSIDTIVVYRLENGEVKEIGRVDWNSSINYINSIRVPPEIRDYIYNHYKKAGVELGYGFK